MADRDLANRIDALEKENYALYKDAERIAAMIEINNLQGRYNLWLESGYYARIWEELFAHKDPRVKCELGDSGIYEGPESVKRLWTALNDKLTGENRKRGYMAFILPMTPYIVVGDDGNTAKGMWTAFGPHAEHTADNPQKLKAYWLDGKYNNEYIKEDGKWKFLSLQMVVYMRTAYDDGWVKDSDCSRWQNMVNAPADKDSVFTSLYHPDGVFYPLPEPPF